MRPGLVDGPRISSTDCMKSADGNSGASSIVATMRKWSSGSGRVEKGDFLPAERPAHVHVGQDETLFVGCAHEFDAGLFANRAVHAVAADQPLRLDRLRFPFRLDLHFDMG